MLIEAVQEYESITVFDVVGMMFACVTKMTDKFVVEVTRICAVGKHSNSFVLLGLLCGFSTTARFLRQLIVF